MTHVHLDELELEPLPGPEDIREDGLEVHATIFYRSSDGKRANGVMRLTPGRITGTFKAEELLVVMNGRMTVSTEGAGDVEAYAGDLIVLEPGQRTTWAVHEPVTIAFNVYHPERSPY